MATSIFVIWEPQFHFGRRLNFKYGSASSNPRGTPHDNLRQPSLAELVTLTPSAIPAQPVKSPNKSEGWWSNALLWYTRATPPQAQAAPMILLLEDDDPKFSHNSSDYG
ncbi:hypothetical protein FRB98_008376 [Tulasnella sp. 332]|nr:hypothetical protein FRB98_008376 [Tulasnella sp. 332]